MAAILNMFGYVKDGDSKNLDIWANNFKDPELTADSVKMGWSQQNTGLDKNPGDQTITDSNSGSNGLYKLVNGLTWKYTNSGSSITLTTSSQQPNLYRAGYTNNPYAYFQVGFGESDNKIKTDATVNVTLKLVSKTKR